MSLEILSSKTIYTQDNITFLEKEIRLPNGETRPKIMMQHPGAVAIVPLTDDGQVILIRQYRLSADMYLYEIPAGTLEPNEAPHLCAERELQEEAGYFPNRLIPLTGFYVAPGISSEYIHVFIARDLRPSTREKDEDEIIEVFPTPLPRALEMITTGEIRDAKTMIGLLMAGRSLS